MASSQRTEPGAHGDVCTAVSADATADLDPKLHRVLIDEVLPRQADVITTADLNHLLGIA